LIDIFSKIGHMSQVLNENMSNLVVCRIKKAQTKSFYMENIILNKTANISSQFTDKKGAKK